MPMTSKEMIKFLRKNGFIEMAHTSGGHRKFQNPTSKRTTIVPCHSKELGKGLEQAILKQAGLKK